MENAEYFQKDLYAPTVVPLVMEKKKPLSKHASNKMTADQKAKLVGLYLEGVHITFLSQRFGVSSEYIRRNIFKEYGIAARWGRRKFEEC